MMIRVLGFSLVFVFMIVCLNKNITCPPVIPELKKEEANQPHQTANETLEHDPVCDF